MHFGVKLSNKLFQISKKYNIIAYCLNPVEIPAENLEFFEIFSNNVLAIILDISSSEEFSGSAVCLEIVSATKYIYRSRASVRSWSIDFLKYFL